MSELESIIWHVLGYSAMPVIFLASFASVFCVAAAILHVFGQTPIQEEVEEVRTA